MAKKNRIGRFLLLLATGFMSVGEASARAEIEVLPSPDTEALPSPEQPEAEGADKGAAMEVCAAGGGNSSQPPLCGIVSTGRSCIPRACDPDVPETECELPGGPDTGDPQRKAQRRCFVLR